MATKIATTQRQPFEIKESVHDVVDMVNGVDPKDWVVVTLPDDRALAVRAGDIDWIGDVTN